MSKNDGLTDVYSDSANLGDNLALTPILLDRPCRLHLFNEPWVRGIAPIFDGLPRETVWFDDRSKIRPPDHISIPRPWTKRVLGFYGLWSVPAIPKIRLSDAELKEGKRVANIYHNPCIIKVSPQKRGERTMPEDVVKRIVAANPDVTFIQFGFSSNHLKAETSYVKAPSAIEFLDVPVRDMAAIYAGVGRYIGCDTGDYHLMLSVGGKSDVICPPNSPTYCYPYVHYGLDCWQETERRVTYHDWTQLPFESITKLNLYDKR
jgi:hypothetical protein